MFNMQIGITKTGQNRKIICPGCIFPLWAKPYNPDNWSELRTLHTDYLTQQSLKKYLN